MILEQKRGPFSEGASFRVGAVDGRGYVHIGIQIPKSQPIEYIKVYAAEETKDKST